jgi:excinuclease ABC subunit B
MMINDEIDKLRHSATSSLHDRNDTIVVASVSCIYGLGAPDEYYRLSVSLRPGDKIGRDGLIKKLVGINYKRNDLEFVRSNFRVKGDVIDIFPASQSQTAVRVEFFGDEIERILEFDAVSGKAISELNHAAIFPASHYAVEQDTLNKAIHQIEADLEEQVKAFNDRGKIIEAYRLNQRVRYDIEMMREIGYCTGIENYSRYFDGRKPGTPPFTLLDYFPKNFLLFIDESHITIPQIRGMFNGDKARKSNLVDYGFRLHAAYDNRPLNFSEFNERIGQVVCVSATPADYELGIADNVATQIIRPTGLLDPTVTVKPIEGQIDDLQAEIVKTTEEGFRTLVTTLTKKTAENLTTYLSEHGLRVRYLHSEIDTLERIDILNALRSGEFDVLVGINLLREGLDLPEVRLVAILDADKEGFLRSEKSLIQTIGRAARNDAGRVIMYADNVTNSMAEAIRLTESRRTAQTEYNLKHGITPKTIQKAVFNSLEVSKKIDTTENIRKEDIPAELEKLKALMDIASKSLDFEQCITIREEMAKLRKRLR